VPATRQGGSFEEKSSNDREKIAYWKVFDMQKCRSNEVLKLRDARTNEQMTVEMAMK